MTASVHDVLELARQHHIKIMLNGDRLRLTAPCPPPEDLVEQLRYWKPEIIKALAERKYCAFTFRLDGGTTINAIRPSGCTLEEMARHLENQYGPSRITGLRGLQGVEPAYMARPSLRGRV